MDDVLVGRPLGGSKPVSLEVSKLFSGLPRKRTSDFTHVHALVAAPPAEDNRRQNEKPRLNASSRADASQQEAIGSKPRDDSRSSFL